jgi:1-acyl-sn-glycerol-3-phosphate acyltransferase
MARVPPGSSRAYRLILFVSAPVMRWSRLHVSGLDCLPATGPAIVVADHDSHWDPIAIAYAARGVRPIRALAKSTLWDSRIFGPMMTQMGHIPVERGASNAEAMAAAIAELRKGSCVGVFPEGTLSRGRTMRARAGVGWLAKAVPEAAVVCAGTTGTVDIVRWPKRPRVRVDFFRPKGGGPRPDEGAADFAQRLLDELRERAPAEFPGRKRTAATHRRSAAEPTA